MVRRGVISLAMCATLVAIPFVVEAQFPGGGGVGGGTGGSGRGAMTRGHPGETRDATPRAPDAAELLLIQLGELDEDLKLAPDQRKAWNRYSESVQQLSGDVSRTRNVVRFPKGNAAEQFDFLADTLRNRVTAFEDIAEAGKALYAQLTPAQREIADRRLARVMISLVDVSQGSGGAAGATGAGRSGGRDSRSPPPSAP